MKDSPRERVIEAYLRKRVKATGGICYKFVSPGRRGVPDRICVWPGRGREDKTDIVFVEVKRPGGKLKPHQEREIDRMVRIGLDVEVISTKAMVDWLVHFHDR